MLKLVPNTNNPLRVKGMYIHDRYVELWTNQDRSFYWVRSGDKGGYKERFGWRDFYEASCEFDLTCGKFKEAV
jgi:hypothetical protein